MKVIITRAEADGSPEELAQGGWAYKDIVATFGVTEETKIDVLGDEVDGRGQFDDVRFQRCLRVLEYRRIEPRVQSALRAIDGAAEAGLLQSEVAEAAGVDPKELGQKVFAPFGRAINNTPGVPKVQRDAIALFFSYPTGPDGNWRYVLRPEARKALRSAGLV